MPKYQIGKQQLNKARDIANFQARVRNIVTNDLPCIIRIDIKKDKDIQFYLEYNGKQYNKDYKSGREVLAYLEKFFNGIGRF